MNLSQKVLGWLLFLIALAHGLSAQELEVCWSEPFQYKNKQQPLHILASEGDKAYLLRGKVNGAFKQCVLEVFDAPTMAKASSIPLRKEFPQSADFSLEKVYVQQGTAYFFLKGKHRLYCSKYHLASQQMLQDAQLLGFSSKTTTALSRSDAHLNVFFSEGSQYIVVYHNLPNDKEGMEKIQYTLLDTNLKQVEQRILNLPYKDKHYQELKYWANAQGDLSILGFKRVPDKREEYLPVLYRYNRQAEKAEEINFPLPQGYLLNSHFTQEKNVLQYHGLFLSQKHVFFYFFRYHEAEAKLASTFYLDLSIPELALQYPTVYKDLNLKQYQVLQLKQLSPDTMLVFLEKQHYSTNEPKGYCFDEVLLIKATTKGHILWMAKIPKRQFLRESSPGSDYQSPAAQHTSKGLVSASSLQIQEAQYLLYNDHRDNSQASPDQAPRQLRFKVDAAMYLARVDKKGKYERQLLAEPEGKAYYLSHTIKHQPSERELFIVGLNSKRREWKLVRLGPRYMQKDKEEACFGSE